MIQDEKMKELNDSMKISQTTNQKYITQIEKHDEEISQIK